MRRISGATALAIVSICAASAACSLAISTKDFSGGAPVDSPGDKDGGERIDAEAGIVREGGAVTSEDGLVGHWAFDEGGGTVARDSSHFGNHGTIVNGAWAFGHEGGAIVLSGTDSHVEIAHHPSLTVTSAFTVALWATVVVVGYDAHLFSRGTGFSILLDGRSPRLEIDGKFAVADYTLPAEQWHHLAVTFTRGKVAWYVDGRSVPSRPGTSFVGGESAPESTAKTLIGTSALGEASCNGSLDDVRLYDRALTSQEVAELAGRN